MVKEGALIYLCKNCDKTTFHVKCGKCSLITDDNTLVPLDAAYYPDFHYESKGFVKDLFGKKKEQSQLKELLESVLNKYNKLLNPYFINFAHIILKENLSNEVEQNNDDSELTYSSLELFQEVLIRKGFDELSDRPDLLYKLLLTTIFSSSYYGFKKELSRHVKNDLPSTLRSWIEETGTGFRKNLSLFFYFIWESKLDFKEPEFDSNAVNDRDTPLVRGYFFSQWLRKSEEIYKDILITRLDTKLANFDPDKFITIYSVDAMDGFKFEEFLVTLFRTIGYDVTETKKTGDQGADLFVERFGKKIVIQAKNYTGTVGNSAVQQALAAKAFYNCDEAMVVTNSYFTKSAKELADSSAVRLIDRNKFMTYLDDYNQQLIEDIDIHEKSMTFNT